MITIIILGVKYKRVKSCKILICGLWYSEEELFILNIRCWNTSRCIESSEIHLDALKKGLNMFLVP